MVSRLLAFGGASLAMVGLYAFTHFVSADARRTDLGQYATTTIEYILNRARPVERFPSWTVMNANSAHHALVVDVEARRVDDARAIAEQILKPMRSRGYQEVLIYVYQVNDRQAHMRRVQWTPRTGFIESAYGPTR